METPKTKNTTTLSFKCVCERFESTRAGFIRNVAYYIRNSWHSGRIQKETYGGNLSPPRTQVFYFIIFVFAKDWQEDPVKVLSFLKGKYSKFFNFGDEEVESKFIEEVNEVFDNLDWDNIPLYEPPTRIRNTKHTPIEYISYDEKDTYDKFGSIHFSLVDKRLGFKKHPIDLIARHIRDKWEHFEMDPRSIKGAMIRPPKVQILIFMSRYFSDVMLNDTDRVMTLLEYQYPKFWNFQNVKHRNYVMAGLRTVCRNFKWSYVRLYKPDTKHAPIERDPKGKKVGQGLTKNQKSQIIKAYEDGYSIIDIYRRYKVSREAIYKILRKAKRFIPKNS